MDETYFYLVRKLRYYRLWNNSSRYEYVMHQTLSRARGAAKNAITQGGKFVEPQMIIRVPRSAMEEIEEVT